MYPISSLAAILLVGCAYPPSPSLTGSPTPPRSSPSIPSGTVTTTSPTSLPTAGLPCTEVTGTRSVWLVSRSDPSQVATPVDPPELDDAARSLVGPDALGRVYLWEEGNILSRSEDRGCTWVQPPTLPETTAVFLTSETTHRLYAYGGGDLYVSEDGGDSFSLVTNNSPGMPIAVQGGATDELRATDGDDVLYASVDGGVSWTTVTARPDYGSTVQVDPAELDRAVFTSGGDLWRFDGTAWSMETLYTDSSLEGARLRDGALAAAVRTGSSWLGSFLVHTETGAAPYDEIPWGAQPDDQPGIVSFDGDTIVVGGSTRADDTVALITTLQGATIHRHLVEGMENVVGTAFFDDVIVVGLQSHSSWDY